MSNKPSILSQVKAARRVSVPLVAITTPDPAATIEAIVQGMNGDAPVVVWDIAKGMRARNEAAKAVIAEAAPEMDPTVANPSELTRAAARFPEKSIVFMHLANRWLADPGLVQGIWNLRDEFKSDHRMLILLGPAIELPAELAGDVVVFDEPLPDPERLGQIVVEQHDAVSMAVKPADIARAVEAVQGLPAFQAEQVIAMSLTKSGLDIDNLWDRKRRQIELTPGLKVMRRVDTFDMIGGLSQVKRYLLDLMNGNDRPNAITWLDEIDKAMPGNTQDTSGVAQDQLGTILSYMEDNEVLGVLLLGSPGSGKSAIAKAAGNSVGVPTVRFDLGACKGSLVGESESRIRNALRVISAVSNDKSMFIATANSVAGLDSALKRRFPFIFYFDLPTRAEKDAIWKIWIRRYELKGQKTPPDDGWSAANIQKCCECAWRLNRTLAEAQRYVVPCARVSGREIEALRKQADGVFLSASEDGVYRTDRQELRQATRKIDMEDK
jgi:hypothetical protein